VVAAGAVSATTGFAGAAGRATGSDGAVSTGAAGAAPGFGEPLLDAAGALARPPSPDGASGNAERSLRTTGASMVDDADLTNSPSSFSLAITSLLV
jgi:hypothetical protein